MRQKYIIDDYLGSGVEGSGTLQFDSLRSARHHIRKKHGQLGEKIRVPAYRDDLEVVESRDNGTSDGWVTIYRTR